MPSNGETARTAALAELLEWTDDIATAEIDQAISQLDANGDLTDEQRAIVDEFGRRLSHRIVAAPAHSLRTAELADETTIEEALQLFELDRSDEPSDR
ncbi:MAG: hypothetical protein SVG88_02060 [Halobacteriales archaeon]|nr:hypothetical protein [Halobacteriales archaeon]